MAAENEQMTQAISVLDRAGIQPAGSFAEFLSAMAARAAEQLERTPAIGEITCQADYRYCRDALAALRKVAKEADEGRKSITSQLDAAKKAVMSFTADSIAPVNEAIAIMDGLKREHEERARAEKRARLEAYWEQTYPALALVTGESEEPLVAFSRVFDPDWVKRVSEFDRDQKAIEAMDALAARIAEGERAIDALDEPAELKMFAKSALFSTLDLTSALGAMDAERKRRADIERLNAAQEAARCDLRAVGGQSEPVEPAGDSGSCAPPQPAVAAPEPMPAKVSAVPERPRAHVTVSLPCVPPTPEVVVVYIAGADEKARAVEAMRCAGLHGAIGKVI